MLRHLVLILTLGLAPLTATAQDTPTPPPAGTGDPLADVLSGQETPPTTLEDLRLTLQRLDEDLQGIRQQLVSTGQVEPGVPFDTTTLNRLDLIETRIRELTGRVEELQFDVRRIAEDGGRRVADLDFRLTELEGGDTSYVAPASDLGGGTSGGSGAGSAPEPQVALTERAAFDAAKARYDAGDTELAVSGFESFLEMFPGGPLTSEARFWLGEAHVQQGDNREAALNFLNAFSGSPTSEIAPEALRRLADTLGSIGQVTEACLTYDEALTRFSGQGEDYTTSVLNAKQSLACP